MYIEYISSITVLAKILVSINTLYRIKTEEMLPAESTLVRLITPPFFILIFIEPINLSEV